MDEMASKLGATKSAATLLILFIPSVDRDDAPIDQETWVTNALKVLGQLLGGATAFPKGRGVWRDDARGGSLLFDEPVIIQCYSSETAIETNLATLRAFLLHMGHETKQAAVGLVVDRDYLEIRL